MNKIYKIFSYQLFHKTDLRPASDISLEVIFRRDGALDPRLSTLDSQFNLTGTIQAKISRVFSGNI